ncbi:MAG: hypothetical protein IH863_02465, partial [Chloroflexi bacterium]|nr:hypothetical protein [Chloroflexota bacterium]
MEDDSQTGEKKRKIKMSLLVPTGMIIPWIGTFGVAPPDAWVHANGNTLGNGSSGGSERANADTEELFTLLAMSQPRKTSILKGRNDDRIVGSAKVVNQVFFRRFNLTV